MHLGGLVAGLAIGLSVFAQKATRDVQTGRRVRTCGQEAVVLVAVLVLLVLMGGAIGALLSAELQGFLRSCPFCDRINCIPMPWWSCCTLALRGSRRQILLRVWLVNFLNCKALLVAITRPPVARCLPLAVL